MPTPFPRRTPSLVAVAFSFAMVYIVWGSTYLAIRFAVEAIPPFLMAGGRFLLAGGLLYAVMRVQVRERPTVVHWRSAAIAGCFLLVGANGLVCWAEQYVASSHAALLVGTMPLWMVTLDWLFFGGPRQGKLVILGLLVGLVGIYLLIGPSKLEGAPVNIPGAAALLCACVFWSIGSLFARRATMHPSSILVTAMEMLAAGPLLLVLGTASGEWARFDLLAVPMKSWLALGYLSIFGSIVALSCYSWLLTVTSPARVATYAYVNPVIAVVLGVWLGNEKLEQRTWVAVAIILFAVVLITTSRQQPRPGTTPSTKKAGDAETAEPRPSLPPSTSVTAGACGEVSNA